ncbi:hypothetical protein PAMP_020824 [Pampus punctatissimus]
MPKRLCANRKEINVANYQKPQEKPPEQISKPNPSQPSVYDLQLVQSRITLLLKKFCSGLWMSKLSGVYSEMFNEKLHPQVLIDLEKWAHTCMVEKPSSTSRADCLIYPPLSPKPLTVPTNGTLPKSPTDSNTITTPISLHSSSPKQSSSPLSSSLDDGCKDNHYLPTMTVNQNPQPSTPTWTSPATTSSPNSESASSPPSNSSTAGVVSIDVLLRIKELLSKYSHGLWVHALPGLFMDTYKTPFPEHVLNNVSLLLDICTVEYPLPHDKKKAILYKSSRADMEATDTQDSQQCRSHPLPSGLKVVNSVVPACLIPPSEQYPSVLITEAKSSNSVTIRYVGDNYSSAQEAMEDAMYSFYIQGSTHHPLSNPVVGQLVAVRGEDGDELARAQLIEVIDMDKVKVTRLEAFSSHPLVLSSLDKLAVGKILLMETLEPCQQNEMPVAVLYDTSQDDDLNINSTCLKAFWDETMNNPLTVNVTYQDVRVTNVCADGIIYCQLPSRGTARLSKLLEETEAFLISQMTFESLVSRPFSGKFCLARYKGKWSRVEIINIYGNKVVEIFFSDLGVPATVEVTELREIPPLFLKDFTIIPPQAIKCCLADLTVPEGDWSPKAVLWVKESLLGAEYCKMKILKLDQQKGNRLVHMYLFIGADGKEPDESLNHQLAQSELWQKLTEQNTITSKNSSMDTGLSALVEKLTLSNSDLNPFVKDSSRAHHQADESPVQDTTTMEPLPLPPPLELPLPGQNMDVFVPVACHPGYFVLQPWQDLHKLVVLMGEMVLYYNQTLKATTATHIQKGEVYAARIDMNWHRVLVRAILPNGLISVYELDHGKHELVHSTLLRPLIEEFRQLPFQAMTAQLAGVTQHRWSEEASVLFRNHVEKRALVAQVQSVQDVSEGKGELWEPRLTVYLVDTGRDSRDLWIHNIMAGIGGEMYSAA